MGDKVFVDYVGDLIELIDFEIGEVWLMKFFVVVMGVLSYVYVEVWFSEGLVDWIGCYVGFFVFFGGVLVIIVCDNFKVGVVCGDCYEL